MAKTEDLDLDVEGSEEPAPKKFPMKLVIIIVAGLLVVSGGTLAALYFTGILGGDAPTEASADEAADEDAGEDGKKDKKGKGDKQAKAPKAPAAPPVFMALDPAFVVNFSEAETTRFLQLTVEVSTRDATALDAMRAHMPIIRNNLVLLFSSQKAEGLVSREGKEKLRADALAEIQKVMTEQTGKPGIENVFFTSFVMQ